MIGIYKITSPSGKIYIGQSVNIIKRFQIYKKLKCKSQTKLYCSFISYGVSTHNFEIIEECCIEELNVRERYWQEYYNVIENGLNLILTKTDDKSGKSSDETKLKLSISHLGKKQTPELIEKRIKNLRGVKRKEETKEKIRKKLLGSKRPQEVIEKLKKHKHTEETKQKMRKPKGPHKNPRKPYKKEKCFVCGKEMSVITISRYHNHNCKFNKNSPTL
jgi:group I intron endonuclease